MFPRIETVDYGDIPTNFNEDEMRKYLVMESKIELPHKRRDSFEEMYKREKDRIIADKMQTNVSSIKIETRKKTLTLPNASQISTKDNTFSDLPSVTNYPNSTSTTNTVKSFDFAKQAQIQTVHMPNHKSIKTSILSKQISMKKKTEQSKDSYGRLVMKQMPFAFKTHRKCHFYVEISNISNDSHIQHIIIHFFKHLTVSQFCDFFREEFNEGKFSKFTLQLFVADDDGDLDDAFPQPDVAKELATLGLSHFYLRFTQNDKNMKSKESIASYQGHSIDGPNLQSTFTEEYDVDDENQNTLCTCSIL